MIIAVSLDRSGPFSFLVDTGSQITMIDPSLAEDHRSVAGKAAHAEGVGFRGNAFLAQVDMLVDNAHNFPCLDESTVLRASMKGAQIMLLRSVPTSDGE